MPLRDFPPHVLREYALLADGERGALVGPRGDVAWMCTPGWEDDAVFATLIGGAGHYSLTPVGRYTWGGYYEPGTLIWNNRWVTVDGIVESREALALPSSRDHAVVLRRIRVLRGTAQLRVQLEARGGFGTDRMVRCRRDDEGVWTGRTGPLAFRWTGGQRAHRAGAGPLVLDLCLSEGEVHDLVLEIGAPLPDVQAPAPLRWSATERAWEACECRVDDQVIARTDCERALAVLTGLTSTRGGMVAAATMGLPERAAEGRSYDYRYAWIRDQCLAGMAAAAQGHWPILDSTVSFVAQRLAEHGPELRPAYTVGGAPVPDGRIVPGLGYPGGLNRLGNHVNGQFQLDGLGESLNLLAAAARADRLEAAGWEAVEIAVAAVEERWPVADAGIWELDDRHWAHSRLMCVSGLRSAAAQAPGAESARWSTLADSILADVSHDCSHPDGRWQRSPTDPRVDAALLMPSIRGALPPTDPRSVATVAAVTAELTRDGHVYRYVHDGSALGETEGAFVLCGLMLCLANHRLGRDVEARALFERSRSTAGSPGLLAEEYDVRQRQLRGNLPQAFVHAMLLEAVAALSART
jgi:hypothetical protein